MLTETEAQEVVDALEEAKLYVPDDQSPLIKKAITDLVERYDVISDDTELVYTEKE